MIGFAVGLTGCGDDDGPSPFDLAEGEVDVPFADGEPSAFPDDDPGEPGGDRPAGTSEGVEDLSVPAVGVPVWHSGYRIEVTGGTVETEERLSGGTLTYVNVDLLVENLTPDEVPFFTPVNLVAGGVAALTADDRSDRPSVPAGLSAPARVVFLLEDGFDLDAADLVIGLPDTKQAVIPIGSGGGEIVAHEPTTLAVSGTIAMELVDLDITGAELRADIPVDYDQVGPGQLALTVTFDATSRRDGNWSIFADDFALVLPDGTALATDGSRLHSLPGSEAGTTTPDHYVRFVLDEPVAGDYTLRFTPGAALVGEDGVTEATLDFSIG